MEFNVRRLAADAGTFLSRAVQFTEEKFGQAEKTELDAHLETLLSRTESTKHWTEKIMKQTEVLLQPNPNVRMEEFLYEMLDKKVPMRANNHELLGECMIDSGHEFGPGTAYGKQKRLACLALIELSDMNSPCHVNAELLLHTTQTHSCVQQRELQSLYSHLPLCGIYFAQKPAQAAETELRIAQSEFDRQAEITRLLLEGISSTHAHHLRCLNDFVDAQATYYAQCYQYMVNLQKQLGSFPSTFSNNNQPAGSSSASISVPTAQPAASLPAPPPSQASPALNELRSTSGTRKARVLYDYDAASSSELSLLSDEVITVSSVPDMDSDWLMGQRGNQKGKVPITYLELLN
uniref:SH3-domain GRB2-like endophilin B1b n=1 Tax=Cyprinus carpio TaxID=7962 RepID=A0A8C2A4G3_CYPCA